MGLPPGREVRRFLRMSPRRPDFGSQHLSRRTDRVPVDWSSSSIALPVDSLADEPVGRWCWASFAFCRPALVPPSLSGGGVRESGCSTRKAVHDSPPSSEANLCWQNRSHITRRTEERLVRGALRSGADLPTQQLPPDAERITSRRLPFLGPFLARFPNSTSLFS